MKKSVVILIAIIYIASIALVSFFGLQFKVFEEIVYTESIEILNTDLKTAGDGTKYVVISPDANGERKYQLLYRVHPDNATDAAVNFVYDKQNAAVSSIDENGVVTFSKKGVVTVTIVSKDGSGASATLKIFATD